MKILWLSHLVPYPPKGGVLQRAHHLLCEIAKYHQVDLLAFNQPALLRPQFATPEAGLLEASRFFGDVCRRHHFVAIPDADRQLSRFLLAARSLVGAPYNIRWLRSKEYEQVLLAWLHDTRYDLIHFDTISLAPYRRALNSPAATVLDHHNIESSTLARRAANDRNPVKKLYFAQEGVRLQRVERRCCPQFSLNITCSDLDADLLRAIAPSSRVATVPNGVDTDYFLPAAEESKLRLIFVGRLNWYPNAQAATFITEELWPLLKQSWPEMEFDLVGANAPEAALQLARRDPTFRVHGFVQDVRPLLARATAYVCPIADGGGTKLKVLDAMAMGKALIAHPIACEGIAVSPEENVLFAVTPHEYVHQLRTVIMDSGRRQMLGRSARQLVEGHYGKVAIGRHLASLFEESVAQDPVSGGRPC